MTNLVLFATVLLFYQSIGHIYTWDLFICQPAIVYCACGNTGISIHLSVPQCSHFYKWRHKCDFCDNFNKESFCSKFTQCLECNAELQMCSTCPSHRYGQFCIGICNCQNGGKCSRSNGACFCPPNFEGENCQIKKLAVCPSPELVLNSVYSVTGLTEGSLVTYECNTEFVLNGQNVRKCTEHGLWSHTLPTCIGTCSKPKLSPNLIEYVVEFPAFYNKVANSSNNPIKSITYKCQDRFKLIGDETIHCKKNGKWNNPPPVCKIICLTPQSPINGSIIGNNFIEGDSIEFNCNSKFVLNGSRKSTCQKNGTWSSSVPKCLNVTICSLLSNIKYGNMVIHDGNGAIIDNQIIFEGFKAIIHCNKDYILMGSCERICQKSGIWSGEPPTCVKLSQNIDCKTKGKDVIDEVGDLVRIDCPAGCFGTSNVIGTAIYSQNSLVCRAAIHIGKITNRGGSFYLINNGLFFPFVSSLLNGIQSLRTSRSTTSFRFVDFEHEVESIDKVTSCPFGWELLDDICLHFPILNTTWKEAKVYCENIQGHLIILDQTDNHFTLTNAMDNKDILKLWIGLENMNDTFLWIDGTHLDDGEFDAWLKGEPQDTKTCVYTSSLGWVSERCEIDLPFVCQFMKETNKNTTLFCPDPVRISNGISSVDNLSNLIFTEGAIVNYSCNQYYYLQGPNAIHCLDNGTWSQPYPKCHRVPSCSEPPIPPNGKIKHIIPLEIRQKREIFRRTNLQVFNPKNTDERLQNKTMKDKTDDMQLSNRTENESFTYFQNGTSLLGNISGFFSRDNQTTIKPDLIFRHLRRKERIAKTNFIMGAIKEETKVKGILHNLPLPPNHHRVGTKVVYDCKSQFYQLIGSKTTTCQDDGYWTDNIPICKPVCGKTSFPRPPLIFNGTISQLGQWPWQVAIAMLLENNNWHIICGGSLLNENWIVTAAHCVTYPEKTTNIPMKYFSIYLGKHFRNNIQDDEYVQEFQVSEIKVHPQYDAKIFDGDIALVKLNRPVELNHRVQPVCLPPSGNLETTELLKEGKKGFVSGWGKTESGDAAEELHYTNVPIVSKQKCEQGYMEADMPFLVTENMFCAGYEEGVTDACEMDSGGPMVFQSGYEDNGKWTLEGIVSWGSPDGCALPKQYGGYTRVERFVDWIDLYI